MKYLPANVTAYNKTPVFRTTTIPKGLLKAHQTKIGTWGRIVVLKGYLLYRILEPRLEQITISKNHHGVVEPGVLHEVEPLGDVSFYIEFYH